MVVPKAAYSNTIANVDTDLNMNSEGFAIAIRGA